MSSRNFRKVVGKNALPPPPEDSDEEYEPLYAQVSGNSKYAGLEVSSESESEHGSPSPSESEDQITPAAQPSSNKKKNKKKNKRKTQKQSADLDEVDRSVQEVNAILGAPPPAPIPKPEKQNWGLNVLSLNPKHLNVANEIRRLFGPDDPEHPRRPRPQQNRVLLLKRVLIHPNKDTAMYEFINSGLSMTKYKDENQRMYFVYDHDANYQTMHRQFLVKYAASQSTGMVLHLDFARRHMHVEALLEIADHLFRMEENSVANEIIENVVTYLQYVAHPTFILSENNVRLEYKFMENRPFHVAMLKYIYLLSNKACHRTALEIAKMMLLVDPSDPLALLSLIDILALRAREHEWLISAIKYFDRQRDAGLLYNIKYSNGLAHYHVAHKNKQDLAEADKIIKQAISAHPQVLVKIMECCSVSDPVLLGHEIFKKEPKQAWSAGLDDLYMIYAKMTGPRWNEPGVMSWLQRNAKELCASHDTDPKVKEDVKYWAMCQRRLFQVWPPEHVRHISILSSMAKLILDAPLTAFYRPTCGWDPLFDTSVNRYNYTYPFQSPLNVGVSRSPVYSFDARNDSIILLGQILSHPRMATLDRFNTPVVAASMVSLRIMGQIDGDWTLRNFSANDVFDDDSDDSYDYDDDDENFEKNERDLAAAMSATELTDDETSDDDRKPNAEKAPTLQSDSDSDTNNVHGGEN